MNRPMLLAVAFVALMQGAAAPRLQEEEEGKVMCTLAVLKSITDAVAGDDFEVVALSKPDQDPHTVSPTPSLMKKLREADLFIEVGMQLELWADQVANGSGNSKILRGAKGRIVVSQGIAPEEVPLNVSRSEGDVHPEGNPHLWIDPFRAKQIAENIAGALKETDPRKAEAVDGRLKAFQDRIDEAMFGKELLQEVGTRALVRRVRDGSLMDYLKEKELSGKLGGWLKKALPLRGVKVIEYHKTWIYLAKPFGFDIVGSIQVKPGIEPGPKHMEELRRLIADQGVRLVIADNFYDLSVPRSLSRDTGVKVVVVPNQPGGEPGTEGYVEFIDHVIDRLVEAVK